MSTLGRKVAFLLPPLNAPLNSSVNLSKGSSIKDVLAKTDFLNPPCLTSSVWKTPPPSSDVEKTQHILRFGQPWTGGGVFGVRNAKYLLKIFRGVNVLFRCRPPPSGVVCFWLTPIGPDVFDGWTSLMQRKSIPPLGCIIYFLQWMCTIAGESAECTYITDEL